MSGSPKTAQELADQIHALTIIEPGDADGYSQAGDALWKAALLAFNYVASQVGATGFMAGWAALRFYGEAQGIDGPFGVVRADQALYPQYDEVAKVRGWIEEKWRPWIVEEARKKLAKDADHASPAVVARWRALAADGGES